MPLKEGEKLQSKSGPWAAWITDLMATYVFADGTLDELLDWDTSRGTGFQCVAGAVSTFSNSRVACVEIETVIHTRCATFALLPTRLVSNF